MDFLECFTNELRTILIFNITLFHFKNETKLKIKAKKNRKTFPLSRN